MGEQTAGGMTGQRIRVHDAALTDVQVAHGPVRSPCPHMSCTSSEPLVYKVRCFPGKNLASTDSNAGDNRTLMEALVVALQAQAPATHSQSNSFNTQAHAKLWTTTVLADERIMRHRAELCLVNLVSRGKVCVTLVSDGIGVGASSFQGSLVRKTWQVAALSRISWWTAAA